VIERTDVDGVAVVRLAHGKVNALDLELLDAIAGACAELDAGPQRAVVLTGSGRVFSAGVDLWRVVDGGPGYVRALLPALTRAFLALFGLGRPVVAAVNGHAIAGGAVLACACDRRLMADAGGRIGVTELLVGVPFPQAALEIVGYAAGVGAVLSGELFEPGAAGGFVDAVVAAEDLLDTAVATAAGLADRIPADTFRLTKEQLHAAVLDRLARLAPLYDERVAELWVRRVEDGSLRRYMEQRA